MKTKDREIVDNILDNFDFMKVHLVMDALDWKWRNEEYSPSISRLIRTADNLISSAIEKKLYHTGTGGFSVIRREYDDGGFNIELSFNVSSWDEDFL